MLSFGVASAQTEKSSKKQDDKSYKKEKVETNKKTSTAAADQKSATEQNTPTINAKDDPARANSSVANPSGMNSPATTTTSPGSTASPTGSKPDSETKP